MKIKLNSKLSPSTLYNTFLESIVYESNSFGKKCDKKAISKGFSFKKKLYTKFGNESEVLMEILELVDNEKLVIGIRSKNGLTKIEYILRPIECGTTLIYFETFQTTSILAQINQNLLSIPFGIMGKNKFKRQIRNLEQQLLS